MRYTVLCYLHVDKLESSLEALFSKYADVLKPTSEGVQITFLAKESSKEASHITLTIDSVFKPLAHNLNLTKEMIQHLFVPSYISRRGHDISKQINDVIATYHNKVVLNINGDLKFIRNTGSEEDIEGFKNDRRDHLEDVTGIVEVLNPLFAFITNEDEYDYFDEEMMIFPPEKPWEYLWGVMFFSKSLLKSIAHEINFDDTSRNIKRLQNDILRIIVTDYIFHREENGSYTAKMIYQVDEARRLLSLKFPYKSFNQ